MGGDPVDEPLLPDDDPCLWASERLVRRKVRGIILWQFVGCDLWRAEASPLRDAFGLPVLPLDANEAAGDAPRQTGRIQAFLEALR